MPASPHFIITNHNSFGGFDRKADSCCPFFCRSAHRTCCDQRQRHADRALGGANVERGAGPLGLQ